MRLRKFRHIGFVSLILAIIVIWRLHAENVFLKKAHIHERITRYSTRYEKCKAVLNDKALRETNFDRTNRQYIVDQIQSIRLYGQCFLTDDSQISLAYAIDPQRPDLDAIQKKLFPAVIPSSLGESLKKAKGRGIIISMSQYGVQDFNNLIRVLDYLNNTLPIQVYHKGELGLQFLESLEFGNQTVDVIDIKSLIPNNHFHRWQRFANKWLPVLFTSFKEVIFMDTDAVPFVNPEAFFDSQQYKTSRSLFFRDRLSNEAINSRDQILFRQLMPSKAECELFKMHCDPNAGARVTNLRHKMESGIFVIDRTKYMPGILVGAALQLWKPTSEVYWGDKELIWLGQLISGECGYQFNSQPGGAIGVVENKVNPLTKKITANHTCSIQLAHIDDQSNLLWINGGLRKCKLGSWVKDWKSHKSLRDKYQTFEKMKTAFLGPTDFNGVIVPHAVIPPRSLISSLFFTQLEAGFIKTNKLGCSGYNWCAYDTDKHPGHTVTFDAKTMQHLNAVRKAWWSHSPF